MSGGSDHAGAPSRRAVGAFALGLAALGTAGRSLAQDSSHGRPDAQPTKPAPVDQEERWRRRYPQPVLVRDLIGRLMLDRDQGVLGHIETVVTKPDGSLVIAFSRRRLLLLRGPVVAVPANVTALLGPFVMILDLGDEEIEALPLFEPAGVTPVDRGSKIRMALTKH